VPVRDYAILSGIEVLRRQARGRSIRTPIDLKLAFTEITQVRLLVSQPGLELGDVDLSRTATFPNRDCRSAVSGVAADKSQFSSPSVATNTLVTRLEGVLCARLSSNNRDLVVW